jgi:hypothetical protein
VEHQQASVSMPTLDAGLGSELHRLQHAIKVGEPWRPIVRYSIPLSITCPTLSHAAMVGPDRCRSYRKVEAGNLVGNPVLVTVPAAMQLGGRRA